MTTHEELPDLDKVKEAISAARKAEEDLLKLNRNAVRHDDGHPIMAPNDEDRTAYSHVKHHGRGPKH